MSISLEHASKMLERERKEGTTCPCCNQHVREYRRKLNSTMARGLIWLVSEYMRTQDWVHVNSTGPDWLIKAGGTLQTLHHWGLIIRKVNTDPKKRTSGYWMPTVDGINFARNKITVPGAVFLYNNEVQGFEDTKISILDALGEHFDYHELIKGNPLCLS